MRGRDFFFVFIVHAGFKTDADPSPGSFCLSSACAGAIEQKDAEEDQRKGLVLELTPRTT